MLVVGGATVFQLAEDSRLALAEGELQLTTGENHTTLQVRVTASGGVLTSHLQQRHLLNVLRYGTAWRAIFSLRAAHVAPRYSMRARRGNGAAWCASLRGMTACKRYGWLWRRRWVRCGGR
jgi:hypothetical protein